MDDPRAERIRIEREEALSLNRPGGLVTVSPVLGDDACYQVVYRCRGLALRDGRVVESEYHRMGIYLQQGYPRQAPRLEWQTEIFHPNILSPGLNGGVCIGSWSPRDTLRKLVLMVGEMVQYKVFNLSDALDLRARDWAAENLARFPVDKRELVDFSTSVSRDNLEIAIEIEIVP